MQVQPQRHAGPGGRLSAAVHPRQVSGFHDGERRVVGDEVVADIGLVSDSDGFWVQRVLGF